MTDRIRSKTKTQRTGSEIQMVPVFRKMEIGAVTVDPDGSRPLEAAVLETIATHIESNSLPRGEFQTAAPSDYVPGKGITDSFVFEYGDCRVAVQMGDAVDG